MRTAQEPTPSNTARQMLAPCMSFSHPFQSREVSVALHRCQFRQAGIDCSSAQPHNQEAVYESSRASAISLVNGTGPHGYPESFLLLEADIEDAVVVSVKMFGLPGRKIHQDALPGDQDCAAKAKQ